MATFTTEAEYVSTGSYYEQILQLKQQLEDYGIKISHIPIKCDNSSAINLSKNPVHHSRTKHIKIKHHFIRDHVQNGDIVLEYMPTKNQLADIFSKPLEKSFHKNQNWSKSYRNSRQKIVDYIAQNNRVRISH